MEKTQWWSPQRLLELQVSRLRELLRIAGEKVPYYRDVFQSIGFDPLAVQSVADLTALPFLTKPIIRENLDRLKALGAHGLNRFNTGGSSGEPLVFFIGKERISHDVAAKWRATRWWDVDIGDPEVVVWGSPIELGAQDRMRALRDKLLRTHLLPAFEMSDANVEVFLNKIQRLRPKILFGYPSALAYIARRAEATGRRMNTVGIRVAFVTGECLYDDQRYQIESSFGCRVANGYGGRDAGFIAHECPDGGMHITAEDIVVEIVGHAGNVLALGQIGEIVVTHLATSDFPFIRYRTGDVAALSESNCKCRRGLPLIQAIRGRTTDFIVAHNGTVIHGLALVYVLRDMKGIRAFKIVQESVDLVRVLIVPNGELSAESERCIRDAFRRRLGSAVEVQIERVAEIAREASGKYRYVVSQVAPDHPERDAAEWT
jgi:phenylacetate-CoA ligase